MISFKQFISESYSGKINWSPPNAEFEHHEVHYQLNQHDEHNHLPDWVHKRLKQLANKREWHKAMNNGQTKTYTRKDVENTNNTGDRWKDVEADAKKRRARKLYGPDKKVERPIILKNPSTGERHLIGGHHRVTYSTQVLNQPAEVHEIT